VRQEGISGAEPPSSLWEPATSSTVDPAAPYARAQADPAAPDEPGRRDLLRLGWLTALLLASGAAITAFTRALSSLRPRVSELRLPDGILARASGEGVIWEGLLVHVEAGVPVVTSLRCTHLGCRLRAEDDGFVCPCHGSRFDRNGALLSGPARTALRRLELREIEGSWVVFVGPADA
jgi:nitrite reductase/ring-hydroxylating ferredoxin subunit